MERLIEDHADLREVLRETTQQPAGSPRWWQLAEAGLSAWDWQAAGEERGILADACA